jgi:hypothetical protein
MDFEHFSNKLVTSFIFSPRNVTLKQAITAYPVNLCAATAFSPMRKLIILTHSRLGSKYLLHLCLSNQRLQKSHLYLWVSEMQTYKNSSGIFSPKFIPSFPYIYTYRLYIYIYVCVCVCVITTVSYFRYLLSGFYILYVNT